MTKDTIDKAIKKQSENSSSNNIEEIIYEGYGPGGTAIIIESFTDNKNRSASEIRTTFNKFDGNLGTSGSVKHLFEKVGIIVYNKKVDSFESFFEFSASINVKDINELEDTYEIETTLDKFHSISESFENKYNIPISANLEWRTKDLIDLNEKNATKFINLVEKLEELEDVQNIFSNSNISDEIMEKLI